MTHRSARPLVLGLVVLVVLAAGGLLWLRTTPWWLVIGPALGLSDAPVQMRYDVSIRAADGGQPVEDVMFIYEWEAHVDGTQLVSGSGSQRLQVKQNRIEGGFFAGHDRLDEHGDRLQVRVTMRVEDPDNATLPSPDAVSDGPARRALRADLVLGPRRPTLRVRITAADGSVPDLVWAFAEPAGEVTGQRGTSAGGDTGALEDGVLLLPVPEWPFRVRAHPFRGKREALSEVLDPENLPERLELVLPPEAPGLPVQAPR